MGTLSRQDQKRARREKARDYEEKESWGEHAVRCAVLSLLKHHSQSTLAKLSPLSQSTISTIANGRYKNRLSVEKCREFGEWYNTFVKDAGVCAYYHPAPTSVPPDSRLTFHPDHEIPLMRAWYQSCPNPSPDKYLMFAYELNKGHVRQDRPKVTAEKVKVWWKNERQRERRLKSQAADVGTMTTGLNEGNDGQGHHEPSVTRTAVALPSGKPRKRSRSSHFGSRSNTQGSLPRPPLRVSLGGDGGREMQCQGHDEGGLIGEGLQFAVSSSSPHHHPGSQMWGRQQVDRRLGEPPPLLQPHPREPTVKQSRKATVSASTSTDNLSFSPSPSPSHGRGLSLMAAPAGGGQAGSSSSSSSVSSSSSASAWQTNFLSWNRRAQEESRTDVNFVPMPVPGALIAPWHQAPYPVHVHQRLGGDCARSRSVEVGERGDVTIVSDQEEYHGQTGRYKYSQEAAFSHATASMDFSSIL